MNCMLLGTLSQLLTSAPGVHPHLSVVGTESSLNFVTGIPPSTSQKSKAQNDYFENILSSVNWVKPPSRLYTKTDY